MLGHASSRCPICGTHPANSTHACSTVLPPSCGGSSPMPLVAVSSKRIAVIPRRDGTTVRFSMTGQTTLTGAANLARRQIKAILDALPPSQRAAVLLTLCVQCEREA